MKAATTGGEQAVQTAEAGPTMGTWLNPPPRRPRSMCGAGPSGREDARASSAGGGAAGPAGWARTAAASSTARADAMGASPGRATVHCWSRARSAVESPGATTSEQK